MLVYPASSSGSSSKDGDAVGQEFRHRDGDLQHQWRMDHVAEVDDSNTGIACVVDEQVAPMTITVNGLRSQSTHSRQ